MHIKREWPEISTPPEDIDVIMRLATRERLTYYDSSYIQSARRMKLILVTDDIELARTAKKSVTTRKAIEVIR